MSAPTPTITAVPTRMTQDEAAIYEQLVNDRTPWNMAAISENLEVQPQTVRKWRKQSLAANRVQPNVPHPNELPPSDAPDGSAIWYAGTIRRWAIQTQRMTPTGQALRLKPPGRPRTAKA